MRIVFGHNNFLIRKYKPLDLGITEGNESGVWFEVRQHYAHLFWIPFFGIGKIYAIRKPNDSSLYIMPDALKELIKAKYPARTPWYTFAGPLLILLGFCWYNLNEHFQRQGWENNFHETAHEQKGFIQYPTTGDYYKLILTDKDGSYDSRKNVFLKVNKYNEDQLEFISLYPTLDQEPASSMDLSRAIEAFDTAARYAYNPIAVPKASLLQSVDTLYSGADQPPVYIEALKSYCRLDEMERRKLD